MEIEPVVQSEEDDLRDIQRSQQTHRLFSEWLSVMNTTGKGAQQPDWGQLADRSARVIDPIHILQFFENEVSYVSAYSESSQNVENYERQLVKIDLEDIQPKIDYWSSSVVCYVVGANPPGYVMDGFIRRI